MQHILTKTTYIIFFISVLLVATTILMSISFDDGHEDFTLSAQSSYLPGNFVETKICTDLIVVGSYYYDPDSYYYCIIEEVDSSINHINLILTSTNIIRYTHFYFNPGVVELNDILHVWPGKPIIMFRSPKYASISYGDMRIVAKRVSGLAQFSILSLSFIIIKLH